MIIMSLKALQNMHRHSPDNIHKFIGAFYMEKCGELAISSLEHIVIFFQVHALGNRIK